MPHPFREVAIAGVWNTEQARTLEGRDSQSMAVEGALGALADAGIGIEEVDGVPKGSRDMVLGARMGPCRAVVDARHPDRARCRVDDRLR